MGVAKYTAATHVGYSQQEGPGTMDKGHEDKMVMDGMLGHVRCMVQCYSPLQQGYLKNSDYQTTGQRHQGHQ